MIKNKVAIALAGLMVAATTYASFPQTIKICLNVENNVSEKILFSSQFRSTDYETHWFKTSGINNGQICVSHLYKQGPKKIAIGMKSNVGRISSERLHISQVNCNLAESRDISTSIFVSKDWELTKATHEEWNLTLKQQFPEQDKKKTFYYTLTCAHTSY